MSRISWPASLTALFFFACCLSSCGPKPEELNATAAVFDQVRAGEIEAVESQLAPDIRTAETRETLAELQRTYIPPNPPDKITLLKGVTFWSTSNQSKWRTIETVRMYEYADRTLIVSTLLKSENDAPYLIHYFHINAIAADQIPDHKLTFLDKPAPQTRFLIGFAISILLMLSALLSVLLSKGFRKKWLWGIVAFAGAPVMAMNWETGETSVSLALGLINTGITRGLGPFDPWVLKTHLPLGALVVLCLVAIHWTIEPPSAASRANTNILPDQPEGP